MPPSSIPAVLKRLADLHAIYTAPGASWWKRWDAKRRAFTIITRRGSHLLEYIAAQDAEMRRLRDEEIPKARRDGFYSGCNEQGRYLRLFYAWKKTRKGKMPKEPKPN